MNFETVWTRICEHEGDGFVTKTGVPFTYSMNGNKLTPSTTIRSIPKSNFEKAFARMPLEKTTQLRDVQGASYVFAIMTDERIFERGDTEHGL